MPTASSTPIGLVKLLSLRDAVKGAVVEFLDGEAMACLKTQDGLVALINALLNYTEEGRALYPVIFVFDSLATVLKIMPASEHVCIGEGPKDAGTMARALKKCAPLALAGWAVYIERKPEAFSFGLLRSGSSTLSVGPEDTLIEQGTPEVPVLMLHQIGHNLIELKGVSRSSVLIHFGASRSDTGSPLAFINGFVDEAVKDVPTDYQEQAATFYRRLLIDVLHASHGTLAVVRDAKKKTLPVQFSDAVPLLPRLEIQSKISELLMKGDSLSGERLQACASLIRGMLLSDGITVFGSDASVLAYNVFVKHPRLKSAEAGAGGARQRTFTVLSEMVGSKLRCAFIQSQDGRVDLYRGKQS